MQRFFATTAAALAALFGLVWPALAAGTINLSLSQQFDAQGSPLSGCKLYFYQAGTTTPQSVYADTDLSIALANPLECDASGRLQQFFLADGEIKIRLTDKNGVTVLVADNLLVIGPSSGGGGGSSVDATTVAQTGDLKVRYSTGSHSGWVRANGRTIGSATSGATERANSDTQALWEHLCTNDTTLRATISGGYSGNCATDYAANKTIQLPDWRGRVIAGLDDMGNSAASVLTATYFGAAATTLGVAGGAESTTFAQANLPNVNFQVTSGQWTPTIAGWSTAHTYIGQGTSTGSLSAGATVFPSNHLDLVTNPPTFTSNPAMNVPSGGSGTPISRVMPARLATIYIKL